MSNEELLMQRCIKLAAAGLGRVSPNPMVGSLIVHQDIIIGEGFHQNFGGPHAEVNAINDVKDKSLLKNSTLYVTLEPCSHHGKTPPCADLIISHGIPKVIIGMTDPNPIVAGKGIQKLKKAGIETIVGVCEEQCRYLNRRFITNHEKKRPFIILKWAKTIDGFIDIDRTQNKSFSRDEYWITNNALRILVHKWRSEEDAIVIGKQTLINDNPTLNVRDWVGKQPIRIVIADKVPKTDDFNLFKAPGKILLFHNEANLSHQNIEYLHYDSGDNSLTEILDTLYNKGISSIIVEGGKTILNSFISQNLWDEARILTGNKHFGRGLTSPNIPVGTIISETQIEGDGLLILSNTNI